MVINGPICAECKFWERADDTEGEASGALKDMGKCIKLSGNDDYEYPDTSKTGIEGTPLCYHDGSAVTFDTKDWFSCIHHEESEADT